ncbi:MAG: hypothetical protein ACI84R_001025 [Candidatus Azotimanducaceae bacterium]|jgi:hypothetical protein
MLAGRPLDIFDQLFTRAFACSSCLSQLPLVLSIAWLLCDTGAVVRHGIYAGRRRGSDRFPLGRNGPWRSKVALVFSDDLNGYLGPVLSGGPV